MSDPILVATAIDKRFGSFRALQQVSFTLAPGEVRALLGVNGAGKSTFIKILSGLYRRDAGEVTVAGSLVDLGTPHSAIAAGIVTVQQHPELVGDLTGYENIFLGHEASGLLFRRAALRQRAYDLATRYELDIDLDRPVDQMSAIERELIAILRAISASDIKVLILDEPTSVLTQREKAVLFALIRRFRQSGVGVIYITHRLDEVFEIADSLTVFRGGMVIDTQPVTANSNAERIAEMMLGASLGNVYPAGGEGAGAVALDLRGLSLEETFEDISVTARRGEILGIFGLLGSGLDDLSKTVFGARQPTAGTISLGDRPVSFASPRDALRAGLFLVPGDRHTEGLVPERDVAFNATLARIGHVSIGGVIDQRGARRQAEALATRVDLQPRDTYRPAGAFSGGNQQKIVIAKGLFADAAVYLFVEPTVGVDIGARSKIYALMRELSRDAAVIVMSSDADEVHGLADRVVGLFSGRVIIAGSKHEISREALLVAGLAGQTAQEAS